MYEHLFKAGRIGSVTLKNRIVMPAMVTGFANTLGETTPQLISYYTTRAKGGVGLIITEATYITEERGVARLAIHNDHMIPGLNDLTEALHEWGTLVFGQLNHQGIYLWKNKNINKLTRGEIIQLCDAFRLSALRARKAGFDGVELHGGHGYLINQFLSPLTNKRTDQYGGSEEKRTAFAKKVIQLIKKEVGKDFPVTIRISAEEKVDGGLTIGHMLSIVQSLQEAGADAINVSIGHTYQSMQWLIPPMVVPRGFLVPLTEKIKKKVEISVITVGRINDPSVANEIIEKGKADFAAMGRALIADPDLPEKLLKHHPEEVRKCIACNYCVGKRFLEYRRLKCSINPEVGKEYQQKKQPPSVKKRILIVGGGPAGMEAARILAHQGHRIYLCEGEKELGGNFRYACLPPHKEELNNILDYLKVHMEKLKVKVKLGFRVNADMIKKSKFDVLLLATGAKPIIPEIKGIHSGNVVLPTDILKGEKDNGKEWVVIGGGKIGCETAEYLAEKNKKVSIIEMEEAIARDLEPITRLLLLERLKKYQVQIYLKKNVFEIRKGGVRIQGQDGLKEEIKADTIVIAVGYTPDRSLHGNISGKIPSFFLIGDCNKAGEIADAIHEAARIASLI
jgi:2,4-dienoyl-CoA reductase-like NADH-dependent reductase (Old Yellow Enzyme family)/thioredoxin reductase